MELLTVTLAYTVSGREPDVLLRLRSIMETVQSAPGHINTRAYSGRTNGSYYLLLTTWEDDESWHKAQERNNAKDLLLETSELLTAPPEQWMMRYLWGYTRPIAPPTIAAAHLMTARPDQGDRAQRGWLKGLQEHVQQPTLSFAFLARGNSDEATAPHKIVSVTGTGKRPTNRDEAAAYLHGPVLLNFFSWGSFAERESFYDDRQYKALHTFAETIGTVRILQLEPLY